MNKLQDSHEEPFPFIKDLKTGDFLENTINIKYRIEIEEESIILIELDLDGTDKKNAKKKRMSKSIVNGLLRTKHLSKTKYPQRISYEDMEQQLELNKLAPK